MCETFDVAQGGVLPTRRRRVVAGLLDAVLLVTTLFLGWAVWSVLVWPRGLTPAKQLLRLRVVAASSGQAVSGREMVLREIGGKLLLAYASCSMTIVASGVMILFSRSQQTVWDLVAKTLVVDDRDGRLEPPRDRPEVVARTLQQAAGVWILALAVAGTVAGIMPTVGVSVDEGGCPTSNAIPLAALACWLLVVGAGVVGAALFWKRDARLRFVALVGIAGSLLGPFLVWILSYNQCWN